MAAEEQQEQEAKKEARELERRKQRMSAQVDRSAEYLKKQREKVCPYQMHHAWRFKRM